MKSFKDGQGILRGNVDGHAVMFSPRPQPKDTVGRYAQNGIQVPSSGRWIVLPGGVIEDFHANEISRLTTITETLFIGLRRDQPIVQDR